MIALFDTSTLIYLLKPDAPAPFVAGSETERVADCEARISYLLADLQKAKATIVIPAPVIGELLVLAGTAGPEWLRILTTSKHFRPSPFETLAAVEYAELAKQRLGARMSRATKAKAKFDEQIVAIARIERATTIYSDDVDIRKLVGDDISVFGIEQLALPPVAAQGAFDLEVAPVDAPPPENDEG